METFVLLVENNSEYIGKQELTKAKAKALKVFDKEILKLYGITD